MPASSLLPGLAAATLACYAAGYVVMACLFAPAAWRETARQWREWRVVAGADAPEPDPWASLRRPAAAHDLDAAIGSALPRFVAESFASALALGALAIGLLRDPTNAPLALFGLAVLLAASWRTTEVLDEAGVSFED